MKFITFRKRTLAVLAMPVVLLVLLVFAPQSQALASGVAPPAGSVSEECFKTVLRVGSKGSCVKQVQQAFIAKGKSVGPAGADGIFGRRTLEAVLDEQAYYGLEIDGVIGSQTWKHLSESVSVPVPPRGESCDELTLTLGSRGHCAAMLQTLLGERGEWIGPDGADGVLGSDSLRGLRHYQGLSGLKVDGKAGPITWAHLLSGKIKLSHLDDECFKKGLRICVDKSDQKTYVINDGELIDVFPSRTGGWFQNKHDEWEKGYTPEGIFRITFIVVDDWSREHEVAMYNSLYLSTSLAGVAIHGSDSFTENGNYVNQKGQAGSDACINLTVAHSKKLLKYVTDAAGKLIARVMVLVQG